MSDRRLWVIEVQEVGSTEWAATGWVYGTEEAAQTSRDEMPPKSPRDFRIRSYTPEEGGGDE